MKCLIVEDEHTSQKLMQSYLSKIADCDIAGDGDKAIEAFVRAMNEKAPYDLICLDIMMPNVDGYETLIAIRQIESELEIAGPDCVKIIMTTVLEDSKNVVRAFREGCEAYIIKPVEKKKLFEEIEKLGLIEIEVR